MTDLRESVARAIEDAETHLVARLDQIGGCANRMCYVTGPRSGMVTNGRCNCLRYDRYKAERVADTFHSYRSALSAALKEMGAG